MLVSGRSDTGKPGAAGDTGKPGATDGGRPG
jgi:hypothetical protein